MNSMTYGIMPSREDFDKAFNFEVAGLPGYEITIPPGNDDMQVIDTALDRMQEKGEEVPESRCVESYRVLRQSWTFTSNQLWSLLTVLCELNPEDIPTGHNEKPLHEDHYPLNIASGILSTLGFEWI